MCVLQIKFLQKQRVLTDKDYLLSEIPSRYRGDLVSLDLISGDLPYKKHIEKYLSLLEQMAQKGIGLYLFGSLGSGKTSIGAYILNQVMAYGCSCHFVTADTFKKEICYNFNKKRYDTGIGEISILDRYRNVHFLLLDDLGAENPDVRSKTEIESLIRYRYNNLKPTIITSNLDSKKDSNIHLESVYDKPLCSILKESTIALKITGIDWRKDNGNNFMRDFLGDSN